VPEKKWTATHIASLPPRAVPYPDPGSQGLTMLVRARQSREPSRTWVLRYWRGGTERRLVLGHFPRMSLADAREEARRLHELAGQGIDPRRARAQSGVRRRMPAASIPSAPHTVGHLADEFMTRFVRPNRKRPEITQAALERDILRVWRERDARSITPREVVDFLDEIVDRGAPVTANRTARLLDQMYRFGVQRRLVDSSPVMILTPPGGKEKARKRTLSDDELRAFLANTGACVRGRERLWRIILVLLLTGARRGELAHARWDDIDFKERTWTIPDEHHKENEGYICPLTDQALEQLRALEALGSKRKSPWVCPAFHAPGRAADPMQLSRRIARCMNLFKKQGIEHFTLHDLRRTVRTGLARLGVLPHVAERVLSHKQRGVIGVYDRYQYLTEKRDALEKWAEHVEGLKPKKA
jgi:integrase